MKEDLLHNLELINTRIQNACEKAGRNTHEVKLLLATKTVSAERIRIALENGHRLIAENKVQELKEKYQDLKDLITKIILSDIFKPIKLKRFSGMK
jgi:uncharacterized pyridoxal phosphate-containing UPF0001 family protein